MRTDKHMRLGWRKRVAHADLQPPLDGNRKLAFYFDIRLDLKDREWELYFYTSPEAALV